MATLDDYKNRLIVSGKDIVDTIVEDVQNSIPPLNDGKYGPNNVSSATFTVPKITVTDHKITNITNTSVTVNTSHCAYCSYCSYCGQNHCTKCPEVKCSDCTRCTSPSNCQCNCACDGCMN